MNVFCFETESFSTLFVCLYIVCSNETPINLSIANDDDNMCLVYALFLPRMHKKTCTLIMNCCVEQVLAPSAGGLWFKDFQESSAAFKIKNAAKCACTLL